MRLWTFGLLDFETGYIIEYFLILKMVLTLKGLWTDSSGAKKPDLEIYFKLQ